MNSGQFLLETMVLSEGFKTRPDPTAHAWLEKSGHRESAFLSVVTIGEIARGIGRLEVIHKRLPQRYLDWFEATIMAYGQRVLPLTVSIARRWGHSSRDPKNAKPDLLIAAPALEHDLTIVTRNVRHFAPTDAKLLNPYEM